MSNLFSATNYLTMHDCTNLILDTFDSKLPRFSKRHFFNVVPMSVISTLTEEVFTSFNNINFSVCISLSGPVQLLKH